MTPDKSKSDRALILTVGTGNLCNLETSLLAPLVKSIETGKWQRIVLLPSMVTDEFAQSLRERKRQFPIEIKQLPGNGLENDADACFGHFDRVIGQLIDQGLAPDRITADFTRGTKAMSAALVLAATGRKVPTLRYIYGARDNIGQVRAGTEEIKEIETALATARRRIDDAKALMRHGSFSGAIELLKVSGSTSSNPVAKSMEAESAAIRAAADVYAAWDRLDYATASAAIKNALDHAPALPDEFIVSSHVRTWLDELAGQPDKQDHPARAQYLRKLACDLVANGERRIRARQFEDALLRGYRVLELIGQIRLFSRGLDSAAIPADRPCVVRLRKKLKRKGSQDFGENKNDTLTAPRELAARLLKELGDKFGEKLLDFDKDRDDRLAAKIRNNSVLIHGFEAKAPSEAGPLNEMFARLHNLLVEDDPEASERISIARHMDFSGG